LVKQKAYQLEARAKMDEKILKHCNDRTIEDEIAVNDKYLDVITAKLKLLDRI
jgi:hypothetical protein